jgi:PAS domain S-box-containing protein
MSKPLNILIVEDSEDDSLLVLRELRRGGYEPVYERVETPDAMRNALSRKQWDIVISDYLMPHFSGFAALELLKNSGIDLPFIIVSGNIGEDIAVEAMRAGADDYIIKGSLARLVPAVERELREAEARRDRKRTEDQLDQSRRRLAETLETINEGFFTLGNDWRLTYVNTKASEMWGKNKRDLIGTVLWDIMPGAVGSIFDAQYHKVMNERVPVQFEALSPLLGVWLEVRAHPNEDGLAVYFHDITARKKAEDDISRLNRLYSVLSKVNEAIVRTNSTDKLYEEVCRIAIEDGGFKMAWIGLIDPISKRIIPAESCGDDGGYLRDINIVAADVREGEGPTGRAVVEGKYQISNDIEHDPFMRPWRDKALSHGFRTSAAFPFRSGGEVIGAFTVYGDQPRAFTNEEIELISSLADDISYAVDSLSNEKLRKEAEKRTEVNNALLKLFTQKYSRKEYLDAACSLVREWSDMHHVGIRLARADSHIPFESCKGYNSEFLEEENALSLKQDLCVCTRIIEGSPASSDLVAMTPNGSFFSGNSVKFVDGLTSEERSQYRGVCMRHRFKSLAVVPIRHQDRPIGAIHLADEREGMVPLRNVEFLEHLASIIGEALLRFNIEDDLRRNFDALQKTSELLERFFSTTHMLIAYMDRDFNFIRVNRAYAEAGYNAPDFYVGQNHFNLYPNEEYEAIFRQVVESGEPYLAYEKPFVFTSRPELEVAYWDWNVFPVKEADGRVNGLIFTLVNVTGRKRAENELRQSLAYNRSLIEASLDPLVTIGPSGQITDANAAAEMATGVFLEELIGTDFSDYFTEPEKARAVYQQVFREGKVMDFPLEMRHRNGQVTPVLYNASTYHDDSGKIIGIFAAARDITALKDAERRTSATNSLLQLYTRTYSRKNYLDEAAEIIRSWCGCRNVGIRIKDQNDRIPFVTCAGFDNTFIESESTLSLAVDQCACTRVVSGILAPEDASAMTAQGSLYYNNAITFLDNLPPAQKKQFRGTCQQRGFNSIVVVPIRYRDKTLGALHLADEQEGMFTAKTVESLEDMALIIGEALYRFSIEEQQVRLASAVEATAEAVVITEPAAGKIQYVNAAFEQITGYTKEEALGNTLHFLDSGRQTAEFYQELRETLRHKGVWRGNLINKKKDGIQYFEDCTISPVWGPAGELLNFVSLKRDVTEKMRLEAIAESVSTMDSIGYIFSGVRHEIGNPINSINMILGLMKAKLPTLSQEAIVAYLDRIFGQISRVEFLLRSLKTFNMYETQEPQDMSIPGFVEQFLPLVREDFTKKGIDLDLQLDPGAERIFADPRALQQVLLNILTNASDAVSEKEHPKIELRIFKSGRMIHIETEDNGSGIPEEKMKDLFKPFYTTKTKGTGLGLVIVKKMLTKMKGTIEVKSRRDVGTLVTITLPEGMHEQR